MNPRFKTNLIEHLEAVGAWARRHRAQVQLDALGYALTLDVQGWSCRLHPQFVGKRDDGRWMYVEHPRLCGAPGAAASPLGFVGWLPYKPLAWDISLCKPSFKALARSLGLDTPAQWTAADAPHAIGTPCLVKRARGAFGDGMRGPFAPAQLAAELARQPLAEGEFLEAFVAGRIARAWYWNGRLTVLEVFDMPSVQGDGRSSVRTLLQQRAPELPPEVHALLALQGATLDGVWPAGRPLCCDYRYVSPFNPTVYANSNVLRHPGRLGACSARLIDRFEAAGRLLWPRAAAPELPAVGRQAGFVLDAIVDADDRPWFLEINSNAQGHPDGYAAMLDALCAPALAQARAA